ncbi:MAG: hypothetical protein LBC87_12720 [Fibromonadaceae bacterium]|jgi:hypothetical protein|nr:hypothetical protein [Fibromonadaceae bacterium]
MPAHKLNPFWPETCIFWGSGATAKLDVPTTDGMAKAVYELSGKDSDELLQKRIDKAKFFHGIEKELEYFLIVLGDNLEKNDLYPSKEAIKAAKKILPDNFTDEKIIEKILKWKSHYNWNALRRLAIKSPLENKDYGKYLIDLYNIIDGNLLSNLGLQMEKDVFLDPHKIRNARNLLVLLSSLMIVCAYHKTRNKSYEKFEPYFEFTKTLSKLMQREAMDLQGFKFSDREFYLMSVAIISMNFDPLLLWFMYMADNELNKNPPHLGKRNLPLKLFIDFSVSAAFRNLEREISYSLDEAATCRTNRDEDGGRLYRICKFFLPHGGANFRECENCGKISIVWGKWGENTPEDLFFPPPFKINLFQHKPYTEDEEKAHKNGDYDAVQCYFCGNLTYTYNTPMIMQTSYKGKHTSFLEDIQRDAKVSISGAKHIILMGYQLPPDDVVWRSTIAAKRNNEESVYCSVVVGCLGENKWIEGEELTKYVADKKKKLEKEKWADYGINAIDAAIAVFGDKNVRAYTGGIPQVWLSGNSLDKDKVKELLYPKKIFPNGVANRSKPV